MNQPLVITCEPHSRWAPLLRRELSEWNTQVRETRSTEQARGELQQHRGSVLVLQLTASGLVHQLKLLTWITALDSSACAVSAGEAIYARMAAEAGAVAHIASMQRWETVTIMARRHMLYQAAAAPEEPATELGSQWRSRLPWPLAAPHSHNQPSPEENQS